MIPAHERIAVLRGTAAAWNGYCGHQSPGKESREILVYRRCNLYIDALLLTGRRTLDTLGDYQLIADIVDTLLAPVKLTIRNIAPIWQVL